jgi:hypothetical protein
MKNIKNFKQFESKLSNTFESLLASAGSNNANDDNEDYMELNKIYTLPSTNGEEINFKILLKNPLTHTLTISIDYFSKIWFDEDDDNNEELVFIDSIAPGVYPSIIDNIEETIINTLNDKWGTHYGPDEVNVKWMHFNEKN